MALVTAMSNLNIKQDQIWNSDSKNDSTNWDTVETHESSAINQAPKPISDASKHYTKTVLSERGRLIEEQIANFQMLKPEEQTNELRSFFMGDTENLLTFRPTDLSQNLHIGQKYHNQNICGHEDQKHLLLYQQNGYNSSNNIDDSFKENCNYFVKSVSAPKYKNYSSNNMMYTNYSSNVPSYINPIRGINKDSHWTYNQNDYRARMNYQEELNKARIAYFLTSHEQFNKEQLALAACLAQSEHPRLTNEGDDIEDKVAPDSEVNGIPTSADDDKTENDAEGGRVDKKNRIFKAYGIEEEPEVVKNDARDGSPFEKYPCSSDGQSDAESEGSKARRRSLDDVMADFRSNGWDTEAGSSGAIQQHADNSDGVSGAPGTTLNLGAPIHNPLLTRHIYNRHQSYPPTRNTIPEVTPTNLKPSASSDHMDLFRLLLAQQQSLTHQQQHGAINRTPAGIANIAGSVPRTWTENSSRYQPLSNTTVNPLLNLASQNLVSFPSTSQSSSVNSGVVIPGLSFNSQAELIQANLLNGFQGHYKKREKRTVQAECGFCRNNGEQPCVYKTHNLKDAVGRVMCPILRDFRCPNCGATGDHAHTIKYCPQASSQDAVQSLVHLRNLRMVNGRRRFPPFSSIENQSKWFQS